jgi:hypothetical protein
MLKKLITFYTKDDEMNRLMNNLDSALAPLFTNNFLDYSLVSNVVLAVGDNQVDHKLSRAPLGWVVTRKRGAGNFYDKQDTNTTPTKNYTINSDAVVTVDIYFF